MWQVFTDSMFRDLLQEMLARTDWSGVADVAALWEADYKQRRVISGFLKDETLGKKRTGQCV